MEPDDKPKVPLIELPSTLKYFANDKPGWKLAALFLTLAAWVGVVYIYKMS